MPGFNLKTYKMKKFERNLILERKYSQRVEELKFSINKNWQYRNNSTIANEIIVDLIKETREAIMLRDALKNYLYKNC